MKAMEVIGVLEGCEFFKGLGTEDLSLIASICEVKTVPAGEALFQQGDYGELLFVIAEGTVHLERSMTIGQRKGKVVIETLGKGRVLGCWSTLLAEAHIVMSTALCQRPTTVLVMRGERLRKLMTDNRELGFNVLERLCFLLRDRIQAAYGAMDKI
jgi:CRP-like cAMP-binding protein